MKKMLAVFCLGLSACAGGQPLQRGMTEQEVTQLEGKRVTGSHHHENVRHRDTQTVYLQGPRL